MVTTTGTNPATPGTPAGTPAGATPGTPAGAAAGAAAGNPREKAARTAAVIGATGLIGGHLA